MQEMQKCKAGGLGAPQMITAAAPTPSPTKPNPVDLASEALAKEAMEDAANQEANLEGALSSLGSEKSA